MTTAKLKSSKIIVGKEAIKDYIGGVSDQDFRTFRIDGMPAKYKKGGTYIAHSDNLDEWFRRYTLVSAKNDINREDEEDLF